MATLVINNIPDTDFAKLRACADADHVSMEDEALVAFRQFLQAREIDLVRPQKTETKNEPSKKVDWANLPLIEDKDELLRAVEQFHTDMGREVNLSPEELKAAKEEGRE